MVPHVAPEQPLPVTVQVTPKLPGSLVTVAVNCSVPLTETVPEVGDTETETAGVVMVTVVDADLVLSATLVAVTVTVFGDGAVAGAVYKPLAEIVPHAGPAQPAPVTVHVTAVLELPVTVALNCCALPACTLGFSGEMLTATGTLTVTIAEPL